MEKITVKLTKKSLYSYTLTVPKEFVGKYGWKERQKFTIEDKGRGVLEIRDWRRR